MIAYDFLKYLLIISIFIKNNNKNLFIHLMILWMSSSSFFLKQILKWLLKKTVPLFLNKNNYKKTNTFDSWHIVILINRSRNSPFVDNFIIFFSLFWICCFICEFRFQPKQENLDSFVFIKFKMYQNLFCSKNQQSVFKWINFQFYWKNNFLFMF